jgi:hypothetical protein
MGAAMGDYKQPRSSLAVHDDALVGDGEPTEGGRR